MTAAVDAGIACSGFLPSRSNRQTRSPAPVRTSRTECGGPDLALFGQGAKATACSTTVTSAEPIGSDGLSGSGALMPKRRATSTILARPTLAGFGDLPPSAIDSFTGTTLIERVIACVSVTAPE